MGSHSPAPPAPLGLQKIARVGTLSDRVAAQLERMIVENQVAPGGLLPTERDLAAHFEVSRTVVREAVKGLAAKGLLEVNAGSGMTVRRPTSKHVAQTMSLYLRGAETDVHHEKVTAVRKLLEVEIAGLAAENRSDEDLKALQAIIGRFGEVAHDRQSYVAWDVEFHLRLAVATRNDLFVLLLDSIGGIMNKVREIGFNVPGAGDRALHHHASILKQVEMRSRDGARQAMREHIEDSEGIMKKGLELNPPAAEKPSAPA